MEFCPAGPAGPPTANADIPAFRPEKVVGGYTGADGGHSFLFAEPSLQPALWVSYLDGARRSYRQHGVESAVEYDDVKDGRSTALFAVALDDRGQVVGGLRVQRPLTSPEQAHAASEWAGRPGTAEMFSQIALRLPFGVVEVKAVWVDDSTDHRAALIAALARAFVHAMDLMQVRYALCTAAHHAAKRWQTSGGVVATEVDPVPYPDARYRTRLMWWDREQLGELITAEQRAALAAESDQLFGRDATAPTLSSVA
jgi:hypothetical protein